MDKDETILLRGSDGKDYPVEPLNITSLGRLKRFIQQDAVSVYYDWAYSPAGMERANDEERARIVANIMHQQPSTDEILKAFNSVDGSLWFLHDRMKELNPNLTATKVDALFRENIIATMAQWCIESGYEPPDTEETTDGVDPTTVGSTTGSEPPP